MVLVVNCQISIKTTDCKRRIELILTERLKIRQTPTHALTQKSTQGGARTLTMSPSLDFESSASTNSATWALNMRTN